LDELEEEEEEEKELIIQAGRVAVDFVFFRALTRWCGVGIGRVV